jgi:hypothetical protein
MKTILDVFLCVMVLWSFIGFLEPEPYKVGQEIMVKYKNQNHPHADTSWHKRIFICYNPENPKEVCYVKKGGSFKNSNSLSVHFAKEHKPVKKVEMVEVTIAGKTTKVPKEAIDILRKTLNSIEETKGDLVGRSSLHCLG